MERLPSPRGNLKPARRSAKALDQLRAESHQILGRVYVEEEIASAKVVALEGVGHTVISGVGRLGRHAAFEIEQAQYLVSPMADVLSRTAYAMTDEVERLARRLR